MVYNIVMNVNIHEFKANLSHFIHLLEQGEQITLCRHNKVIGDINITPHKQKQRRPAAGAFKDIIEINPAFFEPLPDEELALWNGEAPLTDKGAE